MCGGSDAEVGFGAGGSGFCLSSSDSWPGAGGRSLDVIVVPRSCETDLGDSVDTREADVSDAGCFVCPRKGLCGRIPKVLAKVFKLVLRPWPLAFSEFGCLFEATEDLLNVDSEIEGISSACPDSNTSPEDDIGKRGFFCWCSTSTSEYERSSATHAIVSLRDPTKQPGNSIFLIGFNSSPILTIMILFCRATIMIGSSDVNSSGFRLRSRPPIHRQFPTLAAPNAGLSSGRV
jgi:hypothetical protein